MLKHLLRGGGSGIQGDSWVATLGRQSRFYNDYGQSVAVAPDGSVYVCGYTYINSDGAQNNNFLLAKFSSSGTVQWQKTIGGSSDDAAGTSVAVAPDGSVYVCGNTKLAGSGRIACLLAKFSSSGTVQWQKTLGGSGDYFVHSVAVAPDGSVYVCGAFELILAKFSSSGTVQWQKTLGGSGYNYGYSVAVAPDGSVYACGYTNSGVGGYDLLFAKFSSSGTVQWKKTLGESGQYRYNRGCSVAVAPDGSVYVCGETTSLSGAGFWDFLIIKFSSSGTVQWQKTFGGSKNDYGRSVAVAPDGSVYVCGYTDSTGDSSYDLLLAKFSSSGTVQWRKLFCGSGREYGYSIAVAPDGSVYVCGETSSVGAGSSDLLLAKITDSLIEQGTVTFDDLTFQDANFSVYNTSLTIASSNLSVSNAGLTVSTPSLTVGTSSLITNLYTL